MRRTVQILSSQITDGGIDVQLDLGEPLPRAKIDPEKFRQVLMNLMQNAIQAMDGQRQGHRVHVGAPVDARAPAARRAAIPSSRRSLRHRRDGAASR